MLQVFNRERLTLSVEETELRALVARGERPLRWDYVSLPPDAMDEGLIVEPAVFARRVTELVDRVDGPRRKAVASIGGQGSIVRILDLPSVPAKMLDQTVRREAARQLPLPVEDLYLFWHKLGEGETVPSLSATSSSRRDVRSGEGGAAEGGSGSLSGRAARSSASRIQTRRTGSASSGAGQRSTAPRRQRDAPVARLSVFTLGVPRETLDTCVAGLRDTGVRLAAMDLKPLALVRAVNRPDVVLADVERNAASVALVRDYVPYLVRSFSLSATGEHPLEERADRLVSEIGRVLDFYSSRTSSRRDSWSPAVCLTGGLAGKRGIRTRVAARWRLVRPRPPLQVPDRLPLPTYLANVGLALKSVP